MASYSVGCGEFGAEEPNPFFVTFWNGESVRIMPMQLNPVMDMPRPRSLVLRMDTTNICNLDCIGCALVDSRKALGEPAGSMKVAMFEKIVNEVFPYLSEVALSCEAEPLLHPQFVRIMKIIAESDHPPIRMTTNGTMFTKERLDAIFDAGIFGLNVSIDGFAPETFARLRKNGDIHTVCEGLDEIVRRKTAAGRQAMDLPRISINYTLMKSDLHELLPLIEYSRRWNLEDFTVTHVYSTFSKDMRNECLSDLPEESDRVLIEAEKKCREYGIHPRFPVLFRSSKPADTPESGWWERLKSRLRSRPAPTPAPVLPIAAAPPEHDLACAAPWNMLKIRWDGRVHPCDLWNADQPLGSLQTHSFEEIWKSEKYTDLRAGLYSGHPTFEHCLKCDRISQDNLEKRN
jgi:radical SAM protein with 4Fe4S-binding SPASM domain